MKKERENCPSQDEGSKRFIKPLDGERAGLQTGRALREEKEEKTFWKLYKPLKRENATTAIRASGKLQNYKKPKRMGRFAIDEDLERMLREEILADDPMAAYMMTEKRAKMVGGG